MQNLKEKYEECVTRGCFISVEPCSIFKIRSSVNKIISEYNDLGLINNVHYSTPHILFNAYYNILHKLMQTFLLFDNKKSFNHECLFAYICYKHPELKIEWKQLDTLRRKRNSLNYYDDTVSFEYWNSIKYSIQKDIKRLIKIALEQIKMP